MNADCAKAGFSLATHSLELELLRVDSQGISTQKPTTHRVKRFELYDYDESDLIPPVFFSLHAEEMFVKYDLDKRDYSLLPVMKRGAKENPNVKRSGARPPLLTRLWRIFSKKRGTAEAIPYEATKSFEAAENRLLKRFEIQIEKPENFQGIDVSRMLEHIGKSFPILEEFTVHLLDRSRTHQAIIAKGDFGATNHIIKALMKSQTPFRVKVETSHTVGVIFDPSAPSVPEGFELLEQSASLERIGRGKQVFQHSTDYGFTLRTIVVYAHRVPNAVYKNGVWVRYGTDSDSDGADYDYRARRRYFDHGHGRFL